MPNYAEAHNNLGIVLQEQGKLDEAASQLRAGTAAQAELCRGPSTIWAASSRCRGSWPRRRPVCERAVSLKPDYAEAHNNLGAALHEQGKLDEAAGSFQQAIRLKPDFAEAYCNLGGILRSRGSWPRRRRAMSGPCPSSRITPRPTLSGIGAASAGQAGRGGREF